MAQLRPAVPADDGRLVVRLSVLYRTHPGQNTKQRPPWFSRPLALLSLRDALARAGADTTVTFVADGGMPEDLRPLRQPDEEVRIVRGGTAAASFRRCVDVALAVAREDPADTVYWLAEDDYLYRPDALSALLAAVQQLPGVAYFTLYTSDAEEWFAGHPSQPALRVPALAQGNPVIAGNAWHRVSSTTSTFGVTRAALLADAALLRRTSRAGAPFDATMWHCLQGRRPYAWRHLLRDLDGHPSPRGVGKVIAKPPMRTVVNLATPRSPDRHRVLVAPVSDLAMHLESAMIPAGAGWAERAAEVAVHNSLG